MAQDQQQLMNVFGSLLSAKGTGGGSDPESDYYKQREKYEKRRMISSIVAPIAGQFLGQLVAAPFREPVNDFLRTEKGRELYGQWRRHDLEKQNVNALTGDIEKFEGNALEYFRHKNLEEMNREVGLIAGEDWKSKQELREVFPEYLSKAEALARNELAQYQRAKNYYVNFPSQEEFLANVQRYGPKSTNLGQAMFRRIKRLFKGQSYDDFVKESIGQITGVNYDIFKQDLDKRPTGVTTEEWGMDTRSLREILAESTEVITPSEMHKLVKDAQTDYLMTNVYNLEKLDMVQGAITANEMGELTAAYLQYSDDPSGKDSPMSNLMFQAIQKLGGLGRDSTIKSPAQVYNQMYKMAEITPEKFKKEDLVEWAKSTVVGRDLLEGIILQADIKNDQGEVIAAKGTMLPGLRSSIFYELFQKTTARGLTIEWAQEQDGILVQGAGLQALNQEERSRFDRTVDLYLGNIIDASRDISAVLIGKQLDTKSLPDGFDDPAQARSNQLALINASMELISQHFLERKDTDISVPNPWPLLTGIRREAVSGVLTGVILPVDQIMESLPELIEEMRTANDIDGSVDRLLGTTRTAADPSFGGDWDAYSQSIAPDVTPDPTGQVIDLSNKTTWPKDLLTDVLPSDDDSVDDFTISKNQGIQSSRAYFRYLEDNPNIPSAVKAQQQYNAGKAGGAVIPGTMAFNYGGMPLQEAYDAWHGGGVEVLNEDGTTTSRTQEQIRTELIEGGYDFSPQPFVDDTFIRIVHMRGATGAHGAIQDVTASKYFKVELGTMELPDPEMASASGIDSKQIGSNMTGEERPRDTTEKVFMTGTITDRAARKLLRENWRNLPDFYKEHIAAQFGNGYLPLLKELSTEYNVSDSDLVNQAGGRYMDGGTLQYLGKGRAQEINERRFAMDVFLKSNGISGPDKISGRKNPVMHQVGLEAYNELIGPQDDAEKEFLNRLLGGSAGSSKPSTSILAEAEAAEAPVTVDVEKKQDSLLGRQDTIYDQIWEISSRHEGEGFVAKVGDKEELNNSGLTFKTYQAIQRNKGEDEPTVDSFKDLSVDEVKEIIREEFYEGPKLDQLPEELQGTVFDHSLTGGSTDAIKLLQAVIGLPEEDQDGIIGEQTLNILQESFLTSIINQYNLARKQDYLTIIQEDESQKQFQTGWLNRIRSYE